MSHLCLIKYENSDVTSRSTSIVSILIVSVGTDNTKNKLPINAHTLSIFFNKTHWVLQHFIALK